ncbi:hypothetical protein AAY473_035715 [Plecturocebus cupreus]
MPLHSSLGDCLKAKLNQTEYVIFGCAPRICNKSSGCRAVVWVSIGDSFMNVNVQCHVSAGNYHKPLNVVLKRLMLLGWLRQENRLNLGHGGCSELRSHHCTLYWATRTKLHLKKKEKKK